MNLYELAHQILFSERLEDKLFFELNDRKVKNNFFDKECPLTPIRKGKYAVNNKQDKFPKKGLLSQVENRAKALHFFANHELLAIEMMAAAILFLPEENESDHKFKIAIAHTLKDEQKHFQLYQNRFHELGIEFGDFSINDFFWKQYLKVENIKGYFALVALTFEAANLDFSKYYIDCFSEYEDHESAQIMNEVYEDEITHVAVGVNYLRKNLPVGQSNLWEYYQQNLPNGISPARAKGMLFDSEGRKRSGLTDEFILKQKEYKDDFNIVNRKERDAK